MEELTSWMTKLEKARKEWYDADKEAKLAQTRARAKLCAYVLMVDKRAEEIDAGENDGRTN